MAIKPIVALALPHYIADKMFRPQDLQRLGEVAAIVGPMKDASDLAEMKRLLADATVAIGGWLTPRFTPELLAGAPKLKLIANSAGTVKHMVSDAAYDRGIAVTTAAGLNATPVAQLTVAMMVAMLKQVPWLIRDCAAGLWNYGNERVGLCRELQEMDIGLIGASRVGREVIRLLKAYKGLRIKVYDPFLPPAAAKELGVELASLEDCCRCEIVSIHAPDLPETHKMINAKMLALIPDHGILINTARGALLDEAALIAEVRRRPLYAWLDVTDPEPPPPDSPLRREPHILLTPHVAGAMQQACRDMGAAAIDEAIRFLAGRPPLAAVTREMLASQA